MNKTRIKKKLACYIPRVWDWIAQKQHSPLESVTTGPAEERGTEFEIGFGDFFPWLDEEAVSITTSL